MGTRNVNNDAFSDTLDFLIVAFCRNFASRDRAIRERSCQRRTLMEYEYINRQIADATREIVGDDYLDYIYEIGEKIGYAHSKVYGLSETDYKIKKKQVKMNIARKMHLLD